MNSPLLNKKLKSQIIDNVLVFLILAAPLIHLFAGLAWANAFPQTVERQSFDSDRFYLFFGSFFTFIAIMIALARRHSAKFSLIWLALSIPFIFTSCVSNAKSNCIIYSYYLEGFTPEEKTELKSQMKKDREQLKERGIAFNDEVKKAIALVKYEVKKGAYEGRICNPEEEDRYGI